MTRFLLAGLLLVSIASTGGQATWAGASVPTIRVMVAQNVAQIEIQGDGRLAVKTLEGQSLDVPSPVVLTVTPAASCWEKARWW